MSVIALVDDLLFQSRIAEAARLAAIDVRFARGVEPLLEACRERPPRLVLADLDSRHLAADEAIQALRAEPALQEVPVLGFVSHVNGERAQAAMAAGCQRVMARGAFVRELPALLQTGLP
jgi:CheY-like chemotaxis protein